MIGFCCRSLVNFSLTSVYCNISSQFPTSHNITLHKLDIFHITVHCRSSDWSNWFLLSKSWLYSIILSLQTSTICFRLHLPIQIASTRQMQLFQLFENFKLKFIFFVSLAAWALVIELLLREEEPQGSQIAREGKKSNLLKKMWILTIRC